MGPPVAMKKSVKSAGDPTKRLTPKSLPEALLKLPAPPLPIPTSPEHERAYGPTSFLARALRQRLSGIAQSDKVPAMGRSSGVFPILHMDILGDEPYRLEIEYKSETLGRISHVEQTEAGANFVYRSTGFYPSKSLGAERVSGSSHLSHNGDNVLSAGVAPNAPRLSYVEPVREAIDPSTHPAAALSAAHGLHFPASPGFTADVSTRTMAIDAWSGIEVPIQHDAATQPEVDDRPINPNHYPRARNIRPARRSMPNSTVLSLDYRINLPSSDECSTLTFSTSDVNSTFASSVLDKHAAEPSSTPSIPFTPTVQFIEGCDIKPATMYFQEVETFKVGNQKDIMLVFRDHIQRACAARGIDFHSVNMLVDEPAEIPSKVGDFAFVENVFGNGAPMFVFMVPKYSKLVWFMWAAEPLEGDSVNNLVKMLVRNGKLVVGRAMKCGEKNWLKALRLCERGVWLAKNADAVNYTDGIMVHSVHYGDLHSRVHEGRSAHFPGSFYRPMTPVGNATSPSVPEESYYSDLNILPRL